MTVSVKPNIGQDNLASTTSTPDSNWKYPVHGLTVQKQASNLSR
jgi:hypothetical protein